MKILKNLLSMAVLLWTFTALSAPTGLSLAADAQRKLPYEGVSRDIRAKVKSKAPEGEWVSIGNCVYHEDLFTVYGVMDGESWTVPVEESVTTPGYYRLIPYGNESPLQNYVGGVVDATYMYINATNPERVYIEDFYPYNSFFFSQLVSENGWSEEVGGFYGAKLDNVISFPVRSVVHYLPGEAEDEEGAWYYTNNSGNFYIELDAETVETPGIEIQSSDYAVLQSIYENNGGGTWYFDNWNPATNSFPGVTFDNEGYVTSIDLSWRGLTGTFPSVIRYLPRLERLILCGNGLSGDINSGFQEGETEKVFYLRGELNDWSYSDEYRFRPAANGLYVLSGVTIAKGSYFKIADADWNTINYGGGDIYLNIPCTLEYNGSNCCAAEDFVNVTMAFDPDRGVFLVTDNPSQWLGAPARRTSQLVYTPDFITMNDGKTTLSYTSMTSTGGWTAENCALICGNPDGTNSSPKFAFVGSSLDDRAVVLNGKTTTPGKLSSPLINEQISTLAFKWAFPFNDTKAQLRISFISPDGSGLYMDIELIGSQYEVHDDIYLDVSDYSYMFPSEYKIVIENKCLSGSSSNKDRVAIFDLEYTIAYNDPDPVDPDPVDPDPVDPDPVDPDPVDPDPVDPDPIVPPVGDSPLQYMDISMNNLEGNIGLFASYFPELTALYAYLNKFSQISPELSYKITEIDLSSQSLDKQVDIDLNGDIMDAVLSMPELMLMPMIGGSNSYTYVFYPESGSPVGISVENGQMYYFLYTSIYSAPNGSSGELMLEDYAQFYYLTGATTPATLTFVDGDANFDLRFDVADLQTAINYIMGYEYNQFNFYGADLFGDRQINVQDVVRYVNRLLAEGIPASVRRRIPAQDEVELPSAGIYVDAAGYVVLESEETVGAFDIMLDGCASVEWSFPADGFTISSSETAGGIHAVAYSMSGADLGSGRIVLGRVADGARVNYVSLSTCGGTTLPCKISDGITTGLDLSALSEVTVAAFNGALSISTDIDLEDLQVSVCDLAGRMLAKYTPGDVASGTEILIPSQVRGMALVQLTSRNHTSTHKVNIKD